MPDWIRFDGYLKDLSDEPDFVELRPHADQEIRIILRRTDVREGSLLVCVGAFIKHIQFTESSRMRTPFFAQSANATACGGPTMCVGGVEMCCRDGRI